MKELYSQLAIVTIYTEDQIETVQNELELSDSELKVFFFSTSLMNGAGIDRLMNYYKHSRELFNNFA